MNKKELEIIATHEQKLYERFKYQKQSAYHYFKFAVQFRKQDNRPEAKFYWKYAKNACIECEKAFASWNAILHLKNMLNIPIEKYISAIDEKALANEKWYYENTFGNEKDVELPFIWRLKKTIL